MSAKKSPDDPPGRHDAHYVDSLIDNMHSPRPSVRKDAVDTLYRLQPDIPVGRLEAALPDLDFFTARSVRILLRKLGSVPRDQTEDELLRKLGDAYYGGLGPDLVGAKAASVLLRILEQPRETEEARRFAASSLGRVGDASAVPVLVRVFREAIPGVWRAAALSLVSLNWKEESATDSIWWAAAREDLSLLPPRVSDAGSSGFAALFTAMLHDGRVDFLATFMRALQERGWSPFDPTARVLCSVLLQQTCPAPEELGPFAVVPLRTLLFKLDAPEHTGVAQAGAEALTSTVKHHGESLTELELRLLWNTPDPYWLHEEIGFEEKVQLTTLYATRWRAKRELIRRGIIDEKGNSRDGQSGDGPRHSHAVGEIPHPSSLSDMNAAGPQSGNGGGIGAPPMKL